MAMSNRVSVHGRALQFDQQQLFLHGRPVGMPFLGRGKIIYVDSQVAGNDGSSPSTALGTLDAAFAYCTANVGDVIVVCPNHAETVTGAGGITHDVAGVSVIGVGVGLQRPRFLMDAGTTVTYLISAADAYVSGLDFASGHSNVATCFDVTGAGAHIDNCRFRNNTTNEDFLTCIKASGADNTSDGLTVTRCDWYTIDTDDAAFITFVGSCLGFRCGGPGGQGNFVHTLSATAAQHISVATGKLLLNARVEGNIHLNAMTAGELFISNDGTTNTGVFRDNVVAHLDTSTTHDAGWEGGGFKLFNNLSTSVDNLSGFVLPAIDVNL
jgi:hypothetical protein